MINLKKDIWCVKLSLHQLNYWWVSSFFFLRQSNYPYSVCFDSFYLFEIL